MRIVEFPLGRERHRPALAPHLFGDDGALTDNIPVSGYPYGVIQVSRSRDDRHREAAVGAAQGPPGDDIEFSPIIGGPRRRIEYHSGPLAPVHFPVDGELDISVESASVVEKPFSIPVYPITIGVSGNLGLRYIVISESETAYNRVVFGVPGRYGLIGALDPPSAPSVGIESYRELLSRIFGPYRIEGQLSFGVKHIGGDGGVHPDLDRGRRFPDRGLSSGPSLVLESVHLRCGHGEIIDAAQGLPDDYLHFRSSSQFSAIPVEDHGRPSVIVANECRTDGHIPGGHGECVPLSVGQIPDQ